MRGEALLCPGGGYEQIDAVATARAKGFRVIVADPFPNPAISRCFDLPVFPVALGDVEGLVSLCREQEVKGILPVPLGRSLLGVSQVNEAMGFEGPTPESTEYCVDKWKFARLLNELSIPHPETGLLRDGDGPHNQGRVLKPRFGSGGRGVRLSSGSESDSDDEKDPNIIQARLRGTEYGIDGLFLPGEARLLQIRRKYGPDQSGEDLPSLPIYESISIPDFSHTLLEYLGRIQGRLAFRPTPFHADVIVSDEGTVWIVELSPRPSGLGLSGPLLRMACGTDAVSEYLTARDGDPFPVGERQAGCFCWAGQPAGRAERVLEVDAPSVEVRQISAATEEKPAAFSLFFRIESRPEIAIKKLLSEI